MIRLVKPSTKYYASFIQAVKEFRKGDQFFYENLDAKWTRKQFDAFVKMLRSQENAKNLPKGYVAASHYWLVDGNTFIGRVMLRHMLTPRLKIEGGHIGYVIRRSKRKQGYGTLILAHCLRKARRLGLKKVLLTCNETNIGSRKIMEKNGGVFDNKVKLPSGKVNLRYWIHLSR
jgi:predicted acetyltransferase